MEQEIKDVQERRSKIVHILQRQILETKLNTPAAQEACVKTLLKIIQNIIRNPTDGKFRKVRTSNEAIKMKVLNVKGGLEFLVEIGFRKHVVDFEASLCLEGDSSEVAASALRVLSVAEDVLLKCAHSVQEKKERCERELWHKKNDDKLRRDETLRAIEQDKEERRNKFECKQ
mmetsp:Transcript_40018/g.55617  ORF Transcript_40018/g.55617 Transcript_40018/m.55617 type:complete len:173 (-) Transcript_40018:120-638(-)|eukprot:CAMPEP_0196587142 /NCGR_PEP_ID=MMETSP1081-20130531/56563_1 /TAXON_ID=36882 /ORGANISM="Pyramimonas amylifera, Strain CCMP720" /LENGTH=172 /DNA_ID=CAMNT_0041909245 /DNA_START=196 /DNA_END=714 /DNA_ORIENTATION=+